MNPLKTKNLVFLILSVVFFLASCKSQQKVSQLDEPEEEEPKEMVRDQVPMEDSDQNMSESEMPTKPTAPAAKPTKEQQLNNYLGSIANASSTASANQSISQALNMFSSPDAVVLLIFYEANGKPSYDEPTTIAKYLNYLKDTNNPAASVEEVVYDANGKIKELVLKK